jgi:flagellin
VIISYNPGAHGANNALGRTISNTKKSAEKLSSGYQINRAADNASGLAVSEKMRAIIRGLGQADRNIADGIGLVNTADGAMQEMHAILQRQREIAVQSANGTYLDDPERKALDDEFSALQSELNRIIDSTEFNKIKVFYKQDKTELRNMPTGTLDSDTVIAENGFTVVRNYNDSWTFRSNNKEYEIHLTAGKYSAEELQDELNRQFSALGCGITAETSPDGQHLRFNPNGRVFDSFGGTMMRKDFDVRLPPDSVLYDSVSAGGKASKAAYYGAGDITGGVDFPAEQNLQAVFTDQVTGKSTTTDITFAPGLHTKDEILTAINDAFADKSIAANANAGNGKLTISANMPGDNLVISGTAFHTLLDGRSYYDYYYIYGGDDGSPGYPGEGYAYESYTSVTVDSANNNFSFYYSGNYHTITLSDGVYATADDMVNAINAQLTSQGITEFTAATNGDAIGFKDVPSTESLSNFSGPLAFTLFGWTGSTPQEVPGTAYKNEGDTQIFADTASYIQGWYYRPDTTYIRSGENDTLTFDLNGANISVTLDAGAYSPNELITELNKKLDGNGVTTLESGYYLRITNPEKGDPDILGKHIGNIGGNAVVTLFQQINDFSVYGSSPYPPSTSYIYSSYYYLDKEPVTIDGTNNKLTFEFNDGKAINLTLTNGVYDTPGDIYDEVVRQLTAEGSRLIEGTDRYSMQFSAITAGYAHGIRNVTGNAVTSVFGRYYGITQPTRTEPNPGTAYIDGRFDLDRFCPVNILSGENDTLSFDVTKDGVKTRYSLEIPQGTYDKEGLVQAIDDQLATIYPDVSAQMIRISTPDGEGRNVIRLQMVPSAEGSFVIDGVGGSASYSSFYPTPQAYVTLPTEPIIIQSGAFRGDTYVTCLPLKMNDELLGQAGCSVETRENANAAIDKIDDSIRYVSLSRAQTGADVNTLEHTQNYVKSYDENLTASESQIRDTDMASEIVKYTASNILQQATQAILAQANRGAQGVLQLLG